jgi:PAS domain S-box-containing protein
VQFNPFEKAEVKVMSKKSKSEELEIRIRELEKKESEYKETIKNLGLNEKRFRKLYEQTPLGYQTLDSQGRFIEVNEAWLNMMGYSRSEVIGKWFGDFMAPHELDAFEQRFPKFISKGEVHVDVQMLKRDGSQITVHIDGRVGKDKRGKFKETHCILYDITELKQAEKALQESEESFRAVTENANDGMIVAADDGTHVYANQRAAEITGYSIEELLKIGMKGLAHLDEIPKLSERIKKRVAGEEVPIHYETTFIHKSGKKLPVEISAAKIYWHGQAADLIIIRDITERKQIERVIQESNEKYRTLVEQSINGIVIAVGPPPKLDFVNLSFARITGYTENELLSMTSSEIYELVHPDDREMFFGRFADRLAGKQVPSHYEFRGITKDKRTVWLEISSQLIDYLGKPAVQAVFADITERKRAEILLQQSLDQIDIVLKASSYILYRCETFGDFDATYVSGNIEPILGYKEDDFLKKGFWTSKIHPEDAPRVFTDLSQLFEHGFHKHEYRFQHKNGSWRWIYDELRLERDEKGNPKDILGCMVDITERKRAEESLAAERQRLFDVLETLPAMICLLTPDYHVAFANRSFRNKFGESRGQHCYEYCYGHTEPCKFCETYEVLKTGKPHRWEVIALDGSIIDVYDFPFKDIDGSPMILEMNIDITDRKLAEESLKLFRALIERSNDAIEVIDPETGHFLDVNEKACADLGYSREELLSLRVFDIDPNMAPSLYTEVPMKELRKTGSSREERLHLRKDGTTFPVEINLSYVQLDRDYLVTVARDITERKRMEKELLRTQKLESVGILAGGIAHDFNNILTAIIGNISLAKHQVTSEDEIFDLLNEAEMASTRAQGLTKQLLTFAKGGTPVKETASIKDIIKESTLFVLRGSKSNCEFSIGEDLWSVEVDVGQFNQVINNIMINASQAMPLGGTIKVTVENLIIEDRDNLPIKPGRYIGISITDQGIGIAEEYLSKIFDPYFTTKQEGSGLGLATTYSIIKRHDGHITVESQLGVGTTIHIYLPAFEKAIPEKKETGLIKGQGRILVMDDEASLRRTAGRMLGKLGYEPEFAKDGNEAIQMVKEAKEAKRPYDAIILDLTVPGGMGGKECITKLLEIDPEIKAIVSSGYSEDPVLSNFQEYGFKGMMPKPFETRSLSKVLHDVLKNKTE